MNPRPPDYEALVRHFAMFFSVGDLRENAAVDPEPGLVGAYLLVHPHPMFWRERQRIAQLASETGPPAIYESAD